MPGAADDAHTVLSHGEHYGRIASPSQTGYTGTAIGGEGWPEQDSSATSIGYSPACLNS